MAEVNFIELHNNLNDALGMEQSPEISFYTQSGVVVLPNTNLPVIQKTNRSYPIVISDWTASIHDFCTDEVLIDVTDNFLTEAIITDDKGIDQTKWSLTNVPFDYGERLVYLSVTQTLGETFYSTPFFITAKEIGKIARIDYNYKGNSDWLSIYFLMWRYDNLKKSEVTTYYEVSTQKTVSVVFKNQKYQKWITDVIGRQNILKLSDVFESKSVYINCIRAFVFEAIDISENETQSDLNRYNIKLSFKEDDTFDPLNIPVDQQVLPNIILSSVSTNSFIALYEFILENFTPTSLVFEYSNDQTNWTKTTLGVTSPQSVNFNKVGTWFFRISHPLAVSNIVEVVVDSSLVANNDNFTIQVGEVKELNVMFNDTLNGNVNITNITTPLRGSVLLLTNKNIQYTHDGSLSTFDSFQYTISNGLTQSTGTVSLTILQGQVNSTGFLTSETGMASAINGCALILTVTRWHNGIAPLPTLGDFIFTDESLTLTFDGQNLWYAISRGRVIQIEETGRVINLFICTAGGGAFA